MLLNRSCPAVSQKSAQEQIISIKQNRLANKTKQNKNEALTNFHVTAIFESHFFPKERERICGQLFFPQVLSTTIFATKRAAIANTHLSGMVLVHQIPLHQLRLPHSRVS